MSDKMDFQLIETQSYTREQLVNEFVRVFPRTNLQNITKFIKVYKQNQSKYSNNKIGEIIIDCVKSGY